MLYNVSVIDEFPNDLGENDLCHGEDLIFTDEMTKVLYG